MRFGLLFCACLALAACANSPLKLDGVNHKVTPNRVTTDHPYLHTRVVWGGMITKTQPLQQTTQIEVLAFPLDYDSEPERHGASLGRFLIVQPGFLDPADYAPGRWLSVVGSIQGARLGHVGDASYRFPLIQAEQLHLWPVDNASHGQTRFHFGIGIQF